MKKVLLIFAAIIAFSTQAKASHVLGGEISWRCLSNGQYIFTLAIYRDCVGINWNFTNEVLDIVGAPLPRDAGGGTFSTIPVVPDRLRLQNSNNGDTSPACNGEGVSCADGDFGTVQAFYYNSAPITMSGTPPSGGWKIYHQAACCRPNAASTDNVNTTSCGGQMLSRAIMYPNAVGQNAFPCFDSSPVFRALPASYICRGQEFTYNHTAIDDDLDSVTYAFDRPYDAPINNPCQLTYKVGYSPTNPTPNTNFNLNNIPSTLDPITGVMNLAVFSGTGARKYLTVIRADSWRNSVRIASVFREIPISVFDCQDLPGSPGVQNSPPVVNLNGKRSGSRNITTITAGQTVTIPVQIRDDDRTDVAPFTQLITAVPDGLLFTQSRGENSPCIISSTDVEPCAYFRNTNPFVDLNATPPISVMKGRGIIGTQFVWQTDCKHIKTRTGFPGTNEGIYNFVMRVSDDHCEIPGLNYPTITVRVKDPIPLTEPIMKGVSVNLDGTTTYNWVPPVDSTNQFSPPVREDDHYESTFSQVSNGQQPSSWASLNNNIRNYQQDMDAQDFSPYNLVNPADPNSAYNILDEFGSQFGQTFDYYVRMKSVSGCTDTNSSIWSEPARIMEITSTPIGVFPEPTRSKVRLTWNRPKPTNAKTYNYFKYESPTHFYVYANDSISNGGAADPNNWYIIGDTAATTYEVNATSCNDFVGFRVEARDTVITWKEGSGPRQDSLDTLYYRTFSVIDTTFMEAGSFIPNPTFDTIRVLADGRIMLRINLAGKRTTGSYKIFENDTSVANLLATITVPDDSVVVLSGADVSSKNIVIQAFDICKPLNKSYISSYNSIAPDGAISDTCAGEFTLTWNQPQSTLGTGIAATLNNVVRYRIYADYDDGAGYKLITTINNGNTTTALISGISKNKNYKFKVEAEDASGGINIGVKYFFSGEIKTNELVPPPTPRCTYVHDDGSVTLSWIPAIDTVNNFADYRIEYKRATENNWTTFVPPLGTYDILDFEETIPATLINAQIEQYDFQITSLGGCRGTSIMRYEPISTIFLSGTAERQGNNRSSDLDWNVPDPSIDYGGADHPMVVNSADSAAILTFGLRGYESMPGAGFVDPIQMRGCRLPLIYRVNHIDSIFDLNPINFRCEVQSNQAKVVHLNVDPPEPENLAMLTFNRTTRELNPYWVGDAIGADSLIFNTLTGFQSGLPIYVPIIDSAVKIDVNPNGPPHFTSIPIATLDARDEPQPVASLAKSECNKFADEDLVFHKSMDVDVEWKVCDSTNVVTWSQYVGLNPNFDVEYFVEFSSDGGNTWQMAPNSTTIDSTYDHLITQGGLTYHYQVTATTLDPAAPSWVRPQSNIDSIFSIFEDTPRYNYLTYATVLPNNDVEIEYYRDTVIPVKGYTVFRGDNAEELLPQAYFPVGDVAGQDRFVFTDVNADVNGGELYYQVASQNDCDIITSRSNFGRTIFLSVQSDDAAMTNTLRWDTYMEWDSTVAYYNIYRTSSNIYSTQVYKTVQPNSAYTWNEYVDDISGETSSDGKFYYRVEAVQGSVSDAAVNGFTHNLNPAVSNSNIAEALQEPLMYVPNAFAPDGVNRTFGPKGQFFDFTQYEMTIYNRWGEQIFISNDINKGWNGEVDGDEASIGSYVYMIRYVDGDGKERRRKGSLTLIR